MAEYRAELKKLEEQRAELFEEMQELVANAKAEGKHVYAITVYVNPDCLLKAARAFLVFRAVEAYGHIFANHPSSQDIEDEKFDLDFSFCVASNESLDKVIAAAKDVSEIDDVVGTEITDIEEEIINKEQQELFIEALKVLDDIELKVLSYMYGINGCDELTQFEISKIVGFSQANVSRVGKRAINKMKYYLKVNRGVDSGR